MAFAAPLAVPAAEALWAGAVAAGGTILVMVGIRHASQAADREFDAAPTSSVQSCPKARTDPACPAIQQAIARALGELKKRYAEMRADAKELYPIRPRALPGIGSWPGHVQQYRGWQVNLRGKLQEAAVHGCPVPPDAW